MQVSPKSGMYGDTPYTIQAGGCGTPGDHIHLTPEYVKTVNQSENVEIYGPSGNGSILRNILNIHINNIYININKEVME